MLELVHLDYEENRALDLMITEYANENLEEMIHCALDYITDSSDVESFSPPTVFAKSPQECLLHIEDLRRFSRDQVLRKGLSPVYQFHLYKIIEWYIEIFSETEEGPLAEDSPITINEMDENLKAQIIEEYGQDAVERYSDIKTYSEEFFYDWDFAPDFLAGAVQLGLDKSILFDSLTSIEELERYTELMDGDTYRKYQILCSQREAQQEQQESVQFVFNEDIKRALLSIQRNPQYWNLQENDLNDRVRDLLRMKYYVEDQSRQGVSLSEENVGEIDFLVSDGKDPIAIMEALILKSLEKGYLSDHIKKLLVNYDPQGYPHACLIMYVTCQKFGSFWKDFRDYINNYTFPYPIENGFLEGKSHYTESKNAHMVLLRNDRSMLLSFYAIHLPKKEKQ